jgi:hypothetical protein
MVDPLTHLGFNTRLHMGDHFSRKNYVVDRERENDIFDQDESTMMYYTNICFEKLIYMRRILIVIAAKG